MAQVEDIDALKSLRIHLLKFAEVIGVSLADADSDVLRTQHWLELEMLPYWTQQIRRREDAVAKAKEAVRMKTLYKDATGSTQSAVDEMKQLKRAQAALEEAQQKWTSTKQYLRRIERAQTDYRGAVSRLNGWSSALLPEAATKLGVLIGLLEEYTASETPTDVQSMAQSVDLIPTEAQQPTDAGKPAESGSSDTRAREPT